MTSSDRVSDLQLYQSDEAASPLACFTQLQFCDASKSRCGPLPSWADAQAGAGELFGTTLEAKDQPLYNNPASRFYWFVALMSSSVPELESILLRPGASSLPQHLTFITA